jgi:hypothetical protein
LFRELEDRKLFLEAVYGIQKSTASALNIQHEPISECHISQHPSSLNDKFSSISMISSDESGRKSKAIKVPYEMSRQYFIESSITISKGLPI